MEPELQEPVISESEADTSGTSDDVSEEETSWISWFCSIRGNEFFCEVDEEYIHDEFNLTGLASEVPYYDYALDTILDTDSPNEVLTSDQQETVDAAAELLYGLIHARYIVTPKGLSAMVGTCLPHDKYNDIAFGRCARVFCEAQPLLPVGLSDQPRKSTVSLYCPRCNDIYLPRSSRHASIDGAYFGTTFSHLFYMTYPALIPPPPLAIYVPRVFGFKIRRAAVITNDEAEAAAEAATKAQGTGTTQGTAGAGATATTSTTSTHQPLLLQQQVRIAGPAGEVQVKITPSKTIVNVSATAAQTTPSLSSATATTTDGAGKPSADSSSVAAVGGGEGNQEGQQQQQRRRQLTTVLPRDAQGRPIGRDGRVVTGGDDFFDEEDAERAEAPTTISGSAESVVGSNNANANGGTKSVTSTSSSSSSSSTVVTGGVEFRSVGGEEGKEEGGGGGGSSSTYVQVQVENIETESIATGMKKMKV